MLKKRKGILVVICFLFLLVITSDAKAAGWYYCASDLDKVTAGTDVSNASYYNRGCSDDSWGTCSEVEKSYKKQDPQLKYFSCQCTKYVTTELCQQKMNLWDKKQTELKKKYTEVSQIKGTTGSILPSCVTADKLSEDCKNISIFVVLLINLGRYLFTIVGALALLMFIYGGITLILSQGNPEKTKKSYEILVATVVGLAIIFSAYILIDYFGKSVVGVKSTYGVTNSKTK